MRSALLRSLTDERIERAFWMALATLAVAVYTLIVFHLGGWFVMDRARAEAAKIITVQRVAPVPATVNLIGCSRHDFQEHLRTCRARARTAEVK